MSPGVDCLRVIPEVILSQAMPPAKGVVMGIFSTPFAFSFLRTKKTLETSFNPQIISASVHGLRRHAVASSGQQSGDCGCLRDRGSISIRDIAPGESSRYRVTQANDAPMGVLMLKGAIASRISWNLPFAVGSLGLFSISIGRIDQ